MKSKGSTGRLSAMNRVTRHHVDRRSVALERLDSITAGAALAGVVGTVGFGVLAAMTFSGTATAATPPTLPDVTIDRSGSNSGSNSGSDDSGVQPIQPNTQDNNGTPFLQAAPAPRSAGGRSHAASGGSG
jgi:hypothetical protein